MTKNLLSNVHFQLRLVKELRGRPGSREIITLPFLGKSKERAKDDHTLDLHATEQSALQTAHNYCERGDKRKGLLPGQFLGVVVVKFESDSSGQKPKTVPRTLPKHMIVTARKRREKGTTTWLYYIEPQSCQAFHVDTTLSGEHRIGEEVKEGKFCSILS